MKAMGADMVRMIITLVYFVAAKMSSNFFLRTVASDKGQLDSS